MPDPGRDDPRVAAAMDVVRTAERLLDGQPPPEDRRAARLHFEIARQCEATLGLRDQARAHYERAFALHAEHPDTLAAVRRYRLEAGDAERALELFDAEARLRSESHQRARLWAAKGRVLERTLGRPQEARQAYEKALELNAADLVTMRALEGLLAAAGDWEALAGVYERAANVVAADPAHRAALVAGRARIMESRLSAVGEAIELYEAAAELDPGVGAVLYHLHRLHGGQHRWRELLAAIMRLLDQTRDVEARVMLLHRAARVAWDHLGDQETAINALESAARESPSHPLVLDALARAYQGLQRWDALVGVLERVVKIRTERREQLGLLHRIGRLWDERLGDPMNARRWHERALELDPTYVPALQALASLYQRTEDWQALIRMHLGESVALGRDDAGHVEPQPKRRAAAHARVAEIVEERLGQPEEAIEHHLRALTFDIDHAPSFKALERLYPMLGRFRELVALYEQAVDRAPDEDRKRAWLFKIGTLYEDQIGEPERAMPVYRRILKLAPRDLGAIHALQRASARAGEHKDLVEALELEAEGLSGTEAAALYQRAGEVLDDHLGDPEGALERLRKALDADPTYAPTLVALGRVYYRLERWEDLIDMYRRELEVTPDGPRAVSLWMKMAEIYEDRVGDGEQALICYRRVLELDPTAGPALTVLSQKLRERKAWQELAQVLELATEAATTQEERGQAWFALGELYEEQLEDVAEALSCYRRALEEAPQHRAAAEGLNRLLMQTGAERELAEALEAQAGAATDPVVMRAARLRAAELWRDRLDEPKRARAAFEAVLAAFPEDNVALMGMDLLARTAGDAEGERYALAQQVGVRRSPEALVAALVAEAMALPSEAERVSAWLRVLELHPGHPEALEALEALALRTSDAALLERVERGRAQKTGQVGARLGELREAEDPREAMQAYHAALQADPESLAAALGLVRVARARHAWETLVEALHALAEQVGDPAEAARQLVEAARVRATELYDPEAAVGDLVRALLTAPESVPAVEQLTRMIGDEDRLADALERAAERADGEAAAALWQRVAQIRAARSDAPDQFLKARLAAQRALEAAPGFVPALLVLAELDQATGQPKEAAARLEAAAGTLSGPDAATVWGRLAALYAGPLGDAAAASRAASAALDHSQDEPDALEVMARLHLQAGRRADALKVASRLIDAAPDEAAEGRARRLVARLEASAGRTDAAADALWRAVELSGPVPDDDAELTELIGRVRGWTTYAAALGRYAEGAEAAGRPDPDAYLALARVQRDQLEQTRPALITLQRGLAACGDEAALRIELAEALADDGRIEEAQTEIAEYLAKDPLSIEAWRAQVRVFQRARRIGDARAGWQVLAALGALRPEERQMLAKMPPRPAMAVAGGMHADMQASFAAETAPQRLAGELMALIGDALLRLHPPHVASWGLQPGDRLDARASHPVRRAADRVAQAMGLATTAWDLALHGKGGAVVVPEMTDPPLVLVPRALEGLDEVALTFELARAMALIARGLHPLDRVGPREIEIAIAAAVRLSVKDFGNGLTATGFLDDKARQVHSTLARKQRKQLDDLAQRLAHGPSIDVAAWRDAAHTSAVRAAALLCDDLEVAVARVKAGDPALAKLSGPRLLQASPALADLVRFWGSDQARSVRRRIGMEYG